MDSIKNGYDQFHGDRALDNQIDATLDIMDNYNNSIQQFEFHNI